MTNGSIESPNPSYKIIYCMFCLKKKITQQQWCRGNYRREMKSSSYCQFWSRKKVEKNRKRDRKMLDNCCHFRRKFYSTTVFSPVLSQNILRICDADGMFVFLFFCSPHSDFVGIFCKFLREKHSYVFSRPQFLGQSLWQCFFIFYPADQKNLPPWNK